jgi:glutathione S-transferase
MSRRLFLTQRSPFARKVCILLAEKGLAFSTQFEDLAARSAEFQALSPLGKVPMFIDEDGTRVFDSTLIAEYLEDRYPTPATLGEGYLERLRHRVLDELADTVAEQAVTLFFDKPRSAASDKATRLLVRALDELCARIDRGELPSRFGLGHAAVISALGYVEFRLGDAHTASRPQLAALIAPHLSRPSVQSAPVPRD